MSANLVVDLGGTVISFVSLPSTAVLVDAGIAITSGGCISSLSGTLVGDIWDGINADTFCNIAVVGKGFGSGPLIVQVQTSDALTSGSFTDPTSGLAQLPTSFSSGCNLIIGSGPSTDATLGILSSGNSGSYLLSGFMAFAAFQRPHRYARINLQAGFYDGTLQAAFISNLKTTGSGGGFTLSPGSGSVNV